MHVKACQLLAKEMQHLRWNVPSSHHVLKINITAYNTKCLKSCTNSSFLEIRKIWWSGMAKESEGLKSSWVFTGDTCINLLSELETVLGFSSCWVLSLRQGVRWALLSGGFLPGVSQVPSRTANSHRHSAWGGGGRASSSQLSLLHFCLKNLMVEKAKGFTKRASAESLVGAAGMHRDFTQSAAVPSRL